MCLSSLADDAWNTPHQESLFQAAYFCETTCGLLNGSRFDALIDQDDPICRFAALTYLVSWLAIISVFLVRVIFTFFKATKRFSEGQITNNIKSTEVEPGNHVGRRIGVRQFT
jgi:hypothetical protein